MSGYPGTPPMTVRVHRDGLRLPDRASARRYHDLRLKEAAGGIGRLKVRPRFPLSVGQTRIGTFTADFSYVNGDGVLVVEAIARGRIPALERWKRAHFSVEYGISIEETAP